MPGSDATTSLQSLFPFVRSLNLAEICVTYHFVVQSRSFSIGRHILALLAAGHIAILAWHKLPWVYNIEQHERNQHRQAVETILIGLVEGYGAFETLGVFA